MAVARALLKDADMRILDEATSDLDSNLEKEVQQAIESMDRDCASVVDGPECRLYLYGRVR